MTASLEAVGAAALVPKLEAAREAAAAEILAQQKSLAGLVAKDARSSARRASCSVRTAVSRSSGDDTRGSATRGSSVAEAPPPPKATVGGAAAGTPHASRRARRDRRPRARRAGRCRRERSYHVRVAEPPQQLRQRPQLPSCPGGAGGAGGGGAGGGGAGGGGAAPAGSGALAAALAGHVQRLRPAGVPSSRWRGGGLASANVAGKGARACRGGRRGQGAGEAEGEGGAAAARAPVKRQPSAVKMVKQISRGSGGWRPSSTGTTSRPLPEQRPRRAGDVARGAAGG